jgi:hypothetical protein
MMGRGGARRPAMTKPSENLVTHDHHFL